ncbi:hypothetical protein [Ruthenibacterium lactatiformans]|uniref:hypothetical protein n=1 Tax=Ruthenibacterium lactatiformans TaxID=1550024 RepID=UPI00399F108A
MHFPFSAMPNGCIPIPSTARCPASSSHLPRGGHDTPSFWAAYSPERFPPCSAGTALRACGAAVRLLPVGVNENTSPTLMTTTDYESCREFVTRKAPFEVFDALKPLTEPETPDGTRLALISVRGCRG